LFLEEKLIFKETKLLSCFKGEERDAGNGGG